MQNNNQSIISGLWKFRDTISNEELMKIAQRWAEDPSYTQVYIRQASKDQNGIGFMYDYDGERESYDQYFDETSDMLKRKFGNDLAGWDISSHTTVVK